MLLRLGDVDLDLTHPQLWNAINVVLRRSSSKLRSIPCIAEFSLASFINLVWCTSTEVVANIKKTQSSLAPGSLYSALGISREENSNIGNVAGIVIA